MTCKGVYRDGIVIIQGGVDLRNGTTVDVNLARAKPRRGVASNGRVTTKTSAAAVSRSSPWDLMRRTRMTRKQRIAAALAARGSWKDRPEWKGKSSARIAAELRKPEHR